MSIRKRLDELEKKSGASEAQTRVWHYLELVKGEPLSEEQRETLKHNNAIDDSPAGLRYIEVPQKIEKCDDDDAPLIA